MFLSWVKNTQEVFESLKFCNAAGYHILLLLDITSICQSPDSVRQTDLISYHSIITFFIPVPSTENNSTK
jgi:hypothetical protein